MSIPFLFLVPAAGKHVSKTPLQEYRKGKGDFPVMKSQVAHSLSPRSKYGFLTESPPGHLLFLIMSEFKFSRREVLSVLPYNTLHSLRGTGYRSSRERKALPSQQESTTPPCELKFACVSKNGRHHWAVLRWALLRLSWKFVFPTFVS